MASVVVYHNVSEDGLEAPPGGLWASHSSSGAVGRQVWRCFAVGSSACRWQGATR